MFIVEWQVHTENLLVYYFTDIFSHFMFAIFFISVEMLSEPKGKRLGT